ncbi:hypothetical protein HGM15179_006743 [Zosterops borbonicus]|uniref:Murine leukemia virus integrase C-terminal domain-containing protein n=1 Tax=Zosterops borbonicus TaxID=364589 RepID=A0A8K1LNE0_9PASS|nr:hypothetical protein HGM15179_006743 [Zosterops borbonicus]
MKQMNEEGSENEDDKHNLFPLQEVPTAPGIIGFVNILINIWDVRAFKKEMGRLLDDPFGVAERLDEFLGSSIYTFEDLTSILRLLFNTEERDMIQQAGIRDWERCNPKGTPGDQKWPSQSPGWNSQTEKALLNIRTMPHSEMGLSPFEMLYGMPYKHGMPVGHPQIEDTQIQPYLMAINRNLQDLRKKGLIPQSVPLGFAIHKINPRDEVLVKTWREVPLTPHWEGPFTVLLTTDTAIRTVERGWMHASRVKKVEPQGTVPKWRVSLSPGDLKIKLQHHRKLTEGIRYVV